MADLDVADGLPNVSSLPANPDAQDTVKDFLDYTEFYPSDLVRSLTLIGQLDNTYGDLTDEIHRLTKTYANLPRLPADSRPDPLELRKQISAALDRAIQCRESAHAEAVRLYDVTERHKHRLYIIKRKLQALPEPPSRDPTPPPVSPQTARARRQELERGPRLTLHVGRHSSGARGGRVDKSRGRHIIPSDESESGSGSDLSPAHRSLDDKRARHSLHKIKTPKTPKVRQPGVMGTNVHSSVAGISTSNALARLTPPPVDALPGSKYAPWFKLTEYEMALLRKQMKKNAIWVPSDVMIRRELARRGRGHENYLAAKAHAEETGEPFLDEDPLPVNFATGSIAGGGETAADGSKIPPKDDTSIMNRGMRLNEAKKLKRTRELEEANRQMKETGDFMKTLFSSTRKSGGQQSATSPSADRKSRELARAARKRKRDESVDATTSATMDTAMETSHAPQEHTLDSPPTKKLKIVAPKSKQEHESSESPPASPTAASPLDPSSTIKTTTTQVPLAPPGPTGPSTPETSSSSEAKLEESTDDTAALDPPDEKKRPLKLSVLPIQTPVAAGTPTSSRPRRESTAPLKDHDRTLEIMPPLRSPTMVITTAASSRPSRQVSSRPSSRAGTSSIPHSIKAASAEPTSKSDRMSNRSESLRRASNASIPITTFESAVHPGGFMDANGAVPVRTRRKPAPGAVAADGEGKGKISRVNRRKGHKRKDAGPGGPGDSDAENDPNEPKYCVCNDVSFGEMIACDNKHCEGEWFHYSCVGIPEGTLPSRVAKWYCPPCRKILRIDEQGNPLEGMIIAVDRLKKPPR